MPPLPFGGSSFVFVKVGLRSVGLIPLAGLRYFAAFLVLLPFLLRMPRAPRSLERNPWIQLAALGLSAYAFGNGVFFWSLEYLAPRTLSLLMSILPILILVGSIIRLRETPAPVQLAGILIRMAGALLFSWRGIGLGASLGRGWATMGLVAFAVFGLLGRELARSRRIDSLALSWQLCSGLPQPIRPWPVCFTSRPCRHCRL